MTEIKSNSRNNPQIWKLAEYLYYCILPPWESELDWKDCALVYKEQMYDKAQELLTHIPQPGVFR